MRAIFFLFAFSILHVGYSHSIAFIHLGPSLPKHLFYTVIQARKFNPFCPIFLIAEKNALEDLRVQKLAPYHVTYVPTESLPLTSTHQQYIQASRNWKGGNYWIYTSERFFYLEELAHKYQLTDLFHLENDVLLFVDLSDLLPVFHQYYAGMIGAIFENDHRGVASLMYIPSPSLLTLLSATFPKEGIAEGATDMETLGKFKDHYHKQYVDFLPIIPPAYAQDHTLTFHPQNQVSQHPACFSNHFEKFGAVFDGMSWGIYLGGWDSQYHTACHPGEIDPYCVFNPSFFDFRWGTDEKGRKIPYLTYKGQTFRLLNLHMHNKTRIPFICF